MKEENEQEKVEREIKWEKIIWRKRMNKRKEALERLLENIACRKEREIKWEKNIQYEGREWTRERKH